MKELFLILLFSKTVLLTPVPIDLYGQLDLIPERPLEAITSGASIQIDVSSRISWDGEDIFDFRQKLSDIFPPGTIEAELKGSHDEKVILVYTGHTEFNDESVRLLLYAEPGVPLDVEFEKVSIKSSIRFEGVRIFWKNFRS